MNNKVQISYKNMLNAKLSRRNLTRLGVGTAFTCALGLSACGAYQADPYKQFASSNSNTSDATESSASSGDAQTITFCLDYTPNTNHTGIYVAQSQGYFKEEGLNVTIVQPADDTAETMIGTGQAQLGISYQDYLANALSSDNPLSIQAIAAVIQHNTSGIMSRKEDGITSARMMENHRYATWDMPVEQATIRQLVERDGGDYSKIQMVPYTVDDEVSGLRSSLFDDVWVYEAWAVQNAIIQDYDINYFSFISIDDVFDYYTPVIAANNDFCHDHPDVVKAFLRAAKRGYEFAAQDSDAAADILCEQVPELNPALVKQSQSYLKDQYIADASSWGVIDDERWSRYFAWLNDHNLLEHPIDTHTGWTMDYLEA